MTILKNNRFAVNQYTYIKKLYLKLNRSHFSNYNEMWTHIDTYINETLLLYSISPNRVIYFRIVILNTGLGKSTRMVKVIKGETVELVSKKLKELYESLYNEYGIQEDNDNTLFISGHVIETWGKVEGEEKEIYNKEEEIKQLISKRRGIEDKMNYDSFRQRILNKISSIYVDKILLDTNNGIYEFTKIYIRNSYIKFSNEDGLYLIARVYDGDVINVEIGDDFRMEIDSNIVGLDYNDYILLHNLFEYWDIKTIGIKNCNYRLDIKNHEFRIFITPQIMWEKRASGKVKYLVEGERYTEEMRENYLSKLNTNPKLVTKIITIDIETYTVHGEIKAYHIGWCKLNKKKRLEAKLYYLTEYNSSEEMILRLFKDVIIKANNGASVYAHNLLKFDVKLMLGVLVNFYQVTPITNGQSIIGYKIEKDGVEITLKDSYLLMPGSLKSLCQSLGISVIKGEFPHKCVNIARIEGKDDSLPKKEDFYNITDDEYYEYISKIGQWNFKIQSANYLRADLMSLYQCIEVFATKIHNEYLINITRRFTLSGTALAIYRTCFLKDVNLPAISQKINNEIKPSYLGGLVNLFIPRGEGVYCYDVNSLYPFAMMGDFPTGKMSVMDTLSIDGFILENINGCCLAEVVSPPDMLHPFLVKVHEGQLIQPLGKWVAMYTSEELIYAKSLGYNVKILKAWHYNKVEPMFREYVKSMYSRKSNPRVSKATKYIYKLLLNTLYGIMGAGQENRQFQMFNEYGAAFAEAISTWNIYNTYEINGVTFLEYDNNSLNQSSFSTEQSEESFSNRMVAAFITGRSRIHMDKLMRKIRLMGGNIYYTDTDSIFTNLHLTSDSELIGSELGKLKDEYGRIDEAYFLTAKSYSLNIGGKKIVKFKGFNHGTVSFDEMKEFYYGKHQALVVSQTRIIGDKFDKLREVERDHTTTFEFKKGEKIFKDGLWVGTKPFYIK